MELPNEFTTLSELDDLYISYIQEHFDVTGRVEGDAGHKVIIPAYGVTYQCASLGSPAVMKYRIFSI